MVKIRDLTAISKRNTHVIMKNTIINISKLEIKNVKFSICDADYMTVTSEKNVQFYFKLNEITLITKRNNILTKIIWFMTNQY